MSMIEAIQKRYSMRTYNSTEIEAEKILQVKEYLEGNQKGPFGNRVRFQLVDASDYDKNELKQLGTYGNITGTRIFIAGAVQKGDKAMEDFGYCMEKNILKATELELGTVWLGGSLNRSTFAKKLNAEEGELIPAVTPLGYSSDHRTMIDRVIRFMSGGKNRKPFNELFFMGDLKTPLEASRCGRYADVLESVRLAPSASNKQPWRLVKEEGQYVFHIFMKENPKYNNSFGEIKIQNIDMGIAMCHFESAARELGLEGSWQANKPTLDAGDLEYIVSWIS